MSKQISLFSGAGGEDRPRQLNLFTRKPVNSGPRPIQLGRMKQDDDGNWIMVQGDEEIFLGKIVPGAALELFGVSYVVTEGEKDE